MINPDRQIVLDTETTGMNQIGAHYEGHCIIEIGAVKNQDLWIALDQAIQTHNIDWQWVKGHSGHRENEICDELAKQGAENPTFEDIGYEG